jgi:magnesium-transporting ATPase (P-type)
MTSLVKTEDVGEEEIGLEMKEAETKTESTAVSVEADHSVAVSKRGLADMMSAGADAKDTSDLTRLADLGGIDGLLAQLKTSRAGGMHTGNVPGALEEYGENDIPRGKAQTYCELLQDQLGDIIIRILLASGTASLIIGLTTGRDKFKESVEALAIFVTVAVVLNVAAMTDWLKARDFAKLNAMSAAKDVDVTRDGELIQIDATELVVGDIVELGVGKSCVVCAAVSQSEGGRMGGAVQSRSGRSAGGVSGLVHRVRARCVDV